MITNRVFPSKVKLSFSLFLFLDLDVFGLGMITSEVDITKVNLFSGNQSEGY
jgi:hypothetical protein